MKSNIRGMETDQAVYSFIVKYILEHCYPPSFEEIGQAVHCSKSTAYYSVQKLIKRGKLVTDSAPDKRITRAFRVKGMKVIKEDM